jgi:quinol monooxygenase YgiN
MSTLEIPVHTGIHHIKLPVSDLGTGPTAPAEAEAGSAVCAVAKLTALPGHEDEVQRLVRSVAQATRQEPGCRAYRVHRAKAQPNMVVVYEEWASPAAMAAHQKTPHMGAFKKAAGSLVDWPPQAELLTPCD